MGVCWDVNLPLVWLQQQLQDPFRPLAVGPPSALTLTLTWSLVGAAWALLIGWHWWQGERAAAGWLVLVSLMVTAAASWMPGNGSAAPVWMLLGSTSVAAAAGWHADRLGVLWGFRIIAAVLFGWLWLSGQLSWPVLVASSLVAYGLGRLGGLVLRFQEASYE